MKSAKSITYSFTHFYQRRNKSEMTAPKNIGRFSWKIIDSNLQDLRRHQSSVAGIHTRFLRGGGCAFSSSEEASIAFTSFTEWRRSWRFTIRSCRLRRKMSFSRIMVVLFWSWCSSSMSRESWLRLSARSSEVRTCRCYPAGAVSWASSICLNTRRWTSSGFDLNAT